MQAGRVLPRTRWLNPHREPAQPAPQVRIAQADNAALPAVPSGAASPHLFPSLAALDISGRRWQPGRCGGIASCIRGTQKQQTSGGSCYLERSTIDGAGRGERRKGVR
jgi:hypothetical protein